MGVVLVVIDGNWLKGTADMTKSLLLFCESPKLLEQSATVSGTNQYCQLFQESAGEVKKNTQMDFYFFMDN